jgi:hypothetical protein
LEVATAEREVGVGQGTRRRADHRLDPLAPELVAVAVEEDVGVLVHRLRREELGVGRPEERLCALRAELAQPRQRALRVREQQVVLGRSASWYQLNPVSMPPNSGRLIGASPS